MVNVLVTGSSDGIGRETAATLAARGHRVVLHARDAVRAEEALAAVPDAAGVVVGDLSSLARTRELAAAVAAVYPDLVPASLSIHEAAAPDSAALMMLAFVLPLVPVTIAYNAFAYWVFRGKLHGPEEGETT